jgi:hypothetical protein
MMFKYPLLPKNTWLYIATILAYSLTMILLQLFVTKETQIQWLSNHFNPIVFTISSYASMLAELPGIVLFGIIVLYKNRSTAFSFALGCTLTGIVVNMLKQLVFSSSVRPRLFAKPRKALNKAFLKVKPNRIEIEGFKANLISLLDRTNDTESEEFHKNLVSDFLKDTYYKQNHFINTKGRNDLVIHNGNTAKSTVGVIIEAKNPTNKSEMLTNRNMNKKAFQELVLYYLRERITHKNLEVKHLIATNINEWFIFDATLV